MRTWNFEKWATVINAINFVTAILIVFFLPLMKSFVPLLILFWILTWLAEGNFTKRFKINNKPALILIVFFFLLHVVGIIYSKNINESLFDTQVMLSLLIFPVTMIGINEFYQKKINYIFFGFISGNVIASLICLGHSFYLFFKWNAPFQYFTYEDLSILIHPSYFAMYLCFAISSLFCINFTANKKRNKILFASVSIFFSVMIYLLSSKTGLIVLAIIFIFFYFNFFKKTSNRFSSWLISAILFVLLSVAILFNSRFEPLRNITENFLFQRSNTEISAEESNSARIKIWESAIEVIKENFWIGVGNGDANETLSKKYKLYKIAMAEEKHLNAHNQFLQTFIETGVIGFLLLVLIFVSSLINSIKRKYLLLTLFLIIACVNFLFESMLETQAGTVFFGFFFALLNFVPFEKDDSTGSAAAY